MKKSNKIRSNAVRQSLLDYTNLSDTLKENTTAAVRDLLSEAVRDTYSKILNEDEKEDSDDYDVEDVDDDSTATDDTDTSLDDANDDDELDSGDTTDDDSSDTDDQAADDDDDNVVSDSGVDDNGDLTGATAATGSDDDGDEWQSFDKYKVSDDEYDLSNAPDEDVVKVYKLLNNDDQVVVNKTDDNKVNIKDNETGAEYLLDLGDDTDADTVDTSFGEDDDHSDDDAYIRDDYAEDGMDYDPDDDEDNDDDKMNESRLFEIALDEYDSHVGYTDNYQDKDPLKSNIPVADDKDKNDWGSKGLRDRGNSKPWSGRKNQDDKPFTAAKGKTVEEEDIPEGGDADASVDNGDLEEATNVGGFVQQNTTSKSHVPNSSGRSARNASKGGKKIKGTATPRYSAQAEETVQEAKRAIKKASKIFRENKELKTALGKFKSVLEEAAVTNVNLGQIIKLISENTTSQDEKKEIIARFGREAQTVEQSKALYESISRDLQKNKKLDITESKQYGAESSKRINETQIYQSKDLLDSLDLMHKICK